jgi:putative spermidine/putrescine transport system permease protein
VSIVQRTARHRGAPADHRGTGHTIAASRRGMTLADHVSRLGTVAVRGLRGFAVIFMVLPLVVAAHQAFLPTVSFELVPKNGFTLRWFGVLFHEEFVSAVSVSVGIAVVATAISLVCGTLAALALARSAFRGREVVNMILLSPMMIPPVVKGLSFALYFAVIGLRPGWVSLLVAHVVITLPYVVRVVYPCFHGLDRSLEEASRNLGATEVQTFWRITFPLIRPGVFAGAFFSFIMSIDDVGVSIYLMTPDTTNVSVLLLTWANSVADNTLAAVSVALVIVTLVVSTVAERWVGFDSILGGVRR